MTFVVKHAVASAVVIAGTVLSSAVLYFSLLVWAIVADGGLGGPLALPGMMLTAFAGSAASVLFFVPVTAMAERLRRKVLRAGRIVEIPIAALTLAAFLTFVFARLDFEVALVFAAIELVLLGAYWWSLQACDVLFGLGGRLWRALRPPRMA